MKLLVAVAFIALAGGVLSAPNEEFMEEDLIVPSSVPKGHFDHTDLGTSDLAHFTELAQAGKGAQTLRAKLCQDGHVCTFHAVISSVSKEQDDKHESDNEFDKQGVSFDLNVTPGSAKGTFVLNAKNFKMEDSDPSTGKAHKGTEGDIEHIATTFQKCFDQSTRSIIQSADGNLEIMAEQNPNKIDKDHECAGYMQEIQSIYASTVEQLAGVYASAHNQRLLQFSETVQDANGKRTTHYIREHHEDGSMTVRHTRAWELPPSKHPQPVLMQGGVEASLSMSAKGHNTVAHDGTSSGSDETTTAKLGADSPKTGFSCTGSDTPDASGKSCNTADVPADKEEAEKVRIGNDTNDKITFIKSEATGLVQKQTLNEFLQEHAEAGRVRVPILQAIHAGPKERQPVDPVNAEQGFPAFLEVLEQAQPSDFEPGQLRREIYRAMESPKIRALTVAKLAKNEIKNGRAVQSLMHAIGRAGTQQTEAIDQLIELGSSPSVDEDARSQAIVALLQAKCYDHDYAIRGLSKLAEPNAQNFMQITALHVQHGLMAHAEHCANNKYTDATANKYRSILSQSNQHLAEAAANKDDAATWILLDAIGNTNSQSAHETEAVAAVANDEELASQTRLLAVRTLGRLYTDGALATLQKLSRSADTEMQKAAELAIAGQHLQLSDARKPPPSEVSTMALTQTEERVGGAEFNIKREKVWPMPSNGDIRAEPKVGIELYRNTNKGGNPFCLHGYAGVDGKAWSWTLSLIQAGGQKCKGYKFYQYLSILGIVLMSKQRGSGKNFNSNWKDDGNGVTHPNTAQFSQAGDQQGYCGMNVDAMDLVATIAYDKDFLDKTRYMTIGGFVISGQVILNGEVGLKVGWGNMGDPNGSGSNKNKARCKSGEIVFAIPYAQATLTGELALDLAVTRGGGGVNVILVKFSLPATSEKMSDSTCGGVFFKAESLGGKVYGFIDVIKEVKIKVGGGCWLCFWKWKIERGWARKWEVTFYEWSSPAVWTSNELKCEGAASGANRNSNSGAISGASGSSSQYDVATPAAGKLIGLKGGKNHRYCADEGNTVKCNRNAVGQWEKFTIVDAGGGKLAFKGGKAGKYCADETNRIKCNRNAIGQWEKFTVVDQGGGWVALKGGKGNRYCADEGNTIKCNRNKIGQWEKFTSLGL